MITSTILLEQYVLNGHIFNVNNNTHIHPHEQRTTEWYDKQIPIKWLTIS